jgi:hypothetical protein
MSSASKLLRAMSVAAWQSDQARGPRTNTTGETTLLMTIASKNYKWRTEILQ